MFRSIKLLLVAFLLSLTILPVQASGSFIDTSSLELGAISINSPVSSSKSKKVTIAKGSDKYTYDYVPNSKYPLQLGNGQYTISLLEHVSGTSYKVLKRETLNVNIVNPNSVYTHSIQNIQFSETSNSTKLAKELTKNAKTTEEKIALIHDYIVKNVKYDFNKTNPSDYTPNLDSILTNKLGVCYDYAAVFAGMLRSLEIPTKLMMGYKNDIKTYHAWNEVYISETNQWVIIDTTYDSVKLGYKEAYTMKKNSADYKISKQY